MIPKEGLFGKITTRDYRLGAITMGFTAFLIESLPSEKVRGAIALLLFGFAIIVIINQMNRVEKGADPADPNL